MADTKFFSFPDSNNSNNDLATLLALNGNNGGLFGGNSALRTTANPFPRRTR